MVISIKIWNFSRSQMMKRTSPLNRLAKSSYHILSNFETVKICTFFEATSVVGDT